MNFMIGCNYWASNAGTDMWREWDEEAVKGDLKKLSSNGVTHMRVFPNWRDFQPVEPVLTGGGGVYEYRLIGDRKPQNPYWLDETMLERFGRFCDLCEEYNILLIVGIVTGWMSGRLFIPPFLSNKNLYTDPTALLFEQRLIKGIVENFKDKKAIWAWDLGNECNCMKYGLGDRDLTTNWTGIIANAIRSADSSRPVVSGMHTVGVEHWDVDWTIKGQAEFCDILTTHPYPMFVEFAELDTMTSYRTTMHALCETKYYENIGNKPCFVEETGCLGPMNANDETECNFFRTVFWEQYINSSGKELGGMLWWCNSDFTKRENPPYTWKMEETELGLIDADGNEKPVIKEMKKMSETVKGFDFELPKAKDDAVCVVTRGQKAWGVGYMTFCLAKQADLNISFAYGSDEIPDSDIYFIPSIAGGDVMSRENYLKIMERVQNGASVYISNDTGALSEFKKHTGVEVVDHEKRNEVKTFDWMGETLEFKRSMHRIIKLSGAKALAYDGDEPLITEYDYGKGKVYYVNFPLEAMLLNKENAFDSELYRVYMDIFKDKLSTHQILTNNKYLSKTLHYDEDGNIYCAIVNHSGKDIIPEFKIADGFSIDKVLYGKEDVINKYDALILKMKRD